MRVSDLIERLQALPSDAEVEVEVHDTERDIRLFGSLMLADMEGDEVNLFARHEPT